MYYMGQVEGFLIYAKGPNDTNPYWRPYMGMLNLFTLGHWAVVREGEERTKHAKEKLDKEEEAERQQAG